MSVISTATAASSAVGMFSHGHKKGGVGAIGDSTGSSASGPTSTQGLFSSLLQSLEEVAGISTSTAATAAGTMAATGTAAANSLKLAAVSNPAAASYGAQLASANPQIPRAMGANLNTSA